MNDELIRQLRFEADANAAEVRRLTRERDSYRDLVEHLTETKNGWVKRFDAAERERNEAHAQVASLTERCEKAEVARQDWSRIYFSVVKEINKAKRERDEAWRALKWYADQGKEKFYIVDERGERVADFSLFTSRARSALAAYEVSKAEGEKSNNALIEGLVADENVRLLRKTIIEKEWHAENLSLGACRAALLAVATYEAIRTKPREVTQEELDDCYGQGIGIRKATPAQGQDIATRICWRINLETRDRLHDGQVDWDHAAEIINEELAEGQDIEGLVNELWRDLIEKDDRTSPEEYPDMALIKRDEFRAALLAVQQKLQHRKGLT